MVKRKKEKVVRSRKTVAESQAETPQAAESDKHEQCSTCLSKQPEYVQYVGKGAASIFQDATMGHYAFLSSYIFGDL
ncbi:hypothetical protein J6590_024864 [Homalodisca vitripennis]|nr:hypothetical protein J6590_024864 [Homalodisca vitripennis]